MPRSDRATGGARRPGGRCAPRARCSRKLHSSEMAIDSTPLATTSSIARIASSSRSATTTFPLRSTRSLHLDDAVAGDEIRARWPARGGPELAVRGERAMRSVSRKPLVVIRPTFAPRSSAIEFVTIVVPFTKRVVEASSSSTPMPICPRDALQRRHHAPRQLGGGRVGLVDVDRPVGVGHDDVGERPSDVAPDLERP